MLLVWFEFQTLKHDFRGTFFKSFSGKILLNAIVFNVICLNKQAHGWEGDLKRFLFKK